MTTEKMNVHQALCELKVLDKRIRKAVNELSVCSPRITCQKTVGGQPVAVYDKKVQSEYESVKALIERRDAIKRAVVSSNAKTFIEVGGKSISVAEAIEMKSSGMVYRTALIDRIRKVYEGAIRECSRHNGELDRKADAYVSSIYGSSASNKQDISREVQDTRKEYVDSNTMILQDPISCLEKLESLDDFVTMYGATLDAAISTSNALTEVEFSY